MELKLTQKDFRFLEATVLLMLFSINFLGQQFLDESIRFGAFVVIVMFILFFYFIKIRKDALTEPEKIEYRGQRG